MGLSILIGPNGWTRDQSRLDWLHTISNREKEKEKVVVTLAIRPVSTLTLVFESPVPWFFFSNS